MDLYHFTEEMCEAYLVFYAFKTILCVWSVKSEQGILFEKYDGSKQYMAFSNESAFILSSIPTWLRTHKQLNNVREIF